MGRPGFLMVGAVLAGLVAAIAALASTPDPVPSAIRVPDDPPLVAAAGDLTRCRTITEPDAACAAAWGALYQIYASPGQVTDIVLQEGEQLVGPGPVAAGDTVRWIIGDTVSGTGATRRVHLLVKPVRVDITTNLIINTDRRTYHVELRATPSAYMASVSWTYPADELLALQLAEGSGSSPISARPRIWALVS